VESNLPSMKNNKDQLNILRDFLNLCTEYGIETWLMGGWGLDFLYSEETRTHSDIDLIVARNDYSSISGVITSFADIITNNTIQKITFSKSGIEFDICFFFEIDQQYYLDLDEKDPLVYPMPQNSFPKDKFSIFSDIEVRTISWEAQFIAKQGFVYYSGQALREKDKQDLCVIKNNLTESLEELETLLPGIKKEGLDPTAPPT